MELSEMAEPQFGGPWTEEKLSRLRKYLAAYMAIFSNNPRAKLLKTITSTHLPVPDSEGDFRGGSGGRLTV
jgi:hypothetical protein